MYISIDGDLIGRKIESLILEEDLEKLRAYHQTVSNMMQEILRTIQLHGGNIYLEGGDNILAFDPQYEATLDQIHALNQNGKGITFSVGLAKEVKLAYMALKYAKRSRDGKIIRVSIQNGKIEIQKRS